MKLYFRISVVLSLVLSIVSFIAMRGPFPLASDGSGPNGDALLAYLVFLISCAALAHTFILAAFFYSSNRSETRIGLCILVASVLLLSSPEIKSLVKKALWDQKYNADPKTKTGKIIGSASVVDFFKQFNEIPPAEKDFVYMNDLKSDLIREGRLDILEQLERDGLAIAEAGREDEWCRLVDSATSSKKLAPEQRLKVLEWLFARGKPFKFSLAKYEFDLLSVEGFLAAFGQIKNPTSQKMFDLLLQHGAGFREENPEYIVWYCARFKYIEPLKFLIAQGADLNYVQSSYNTSALDEAINNNDQPTIQELLKAGAKKANELKK